MHVLPEYRLSVLVLILISSQTVPGLGYLFRTVPLHGRAPAPDRENDFAQEDVPESAELVDDLAIADCTSPELLTCGQSIAFSPTFQVPVFYFTIHDSRACLSMQWGLVLLNTKVTQMGLHCGSKI